MALPRLHLWRTTTSLKRETMKKRPPAKDSPGRDRQSPRRSPPYNLRQRRNAISGPSGQARGAVNPTSLAVALSRLQDAQNSQSASETPIDRESDSGSCAVVSTGPSASGNLSSTHSSSPQPRAPQGTRRTGRQLNIPIRPARQARQARTPRRRIHPASDSATLDGAGNDESHSPRGPSAGDPSTSHELHNNYNNSIQTRARQHPRSQEESDPMREEQGLDFRGKRP